MATGTTPTMTVLHLESGHVLGVAAAGSRALTVADLTGGKHLAVRLPDSPLVVQVPAELLTATVAALDDDVLSRPLEFRVGTGTPALTYAGPPINVKATSGAELVAAEGSKVVSLGQTADEVEVVEGVVEGTVASGSTPPGGTHRLIACVTGPLAYGPSP
jgi:hypothetical protein